MKKLVVLLVVLVGMGGTAMSQTSVGHVDTRKLFDTIPSGKLVNDQLVQIQKEEYEELVAKQKKFTDDVALYQATAADLLPLAREHKEKKLGEQEQQLAKDQKTAEEYIQQMSMELSTPLEDRVKRAIAIVAKKLKLNYVLESSSLIYSDGGKDITNEVAKVLLELDAKEAPPATAPN